MTNRRWWATLMALSGAFISALATRLDAQVVDVPDSVYIREHYVKQTYHIRMRDGARLFTIAYVPRDASPARRYPIVLQRTPFSIAPYGDTVYAATLAPDRFMLHEGYIFVSQEVRGRYLSEGTFENVRPMLADSVRARRPDAVDEVSDAYDTVEWLVRNVAGNSGRVGLFGISYGGYYAAAGALSHHPAIVAMSLQAPVADFYFEDFHHNGALQQAALHAYPVFGVPRGAAPTTAHWWLPAFLRAVAPDTSADDYAYQLGLGPLRNVTARIHPDDVWWREMVAHPDYDAFWRARALPARLRGLTYPVLVVGGWFDAENLYGTLAVYRALRAWSPAADVVLAMGPFGHRDWTVRDVAHTVHGNLYFGDSLALAFQRDVEAPFFRAQLKGDSGDVVPANATMFDTGRKRWARFDRWPASGTARRDYYFHRDGGLTVRAPTEARAFAEFVSDPRAPVPSRCTGRTIEDGATYDYMSDDQRCYTARPDVLVFRTDVLREDVTFAGALTARIMLSTTATDADVVVKLVDVYPSDEPNHPYMRDTTVRLGGYQQLVRGEIMRGRFRRSFSAPAPFSPGETEEVTVRLPDVFHTFRAGHRIMVQVQGSWFPLFDRNPQRYVPSIYEADAGDFVRATHRVRMDRAAASRLEVELLP